MTTDAVESAQALSGPLADVQAAYRKRRELARRLADQDRYIGQTVREAHRDGVSYAAMARVAQVSDVAVLKAARRKDPT